MNLYNNIEKAIRHHEEILYVDGNVLESDVRHAIRWVMRDNPDIFWFVHQYHFDQDKRTISFRYQFSKERSELIQKSIEDVVENDFQVTYVSSLDVYEQVMYVYKWLLTYCNYNVNSAYNQNIDSVFVRRNSVCTGYAKAAQYLFKLLGIESWLVFGRLNIDGEEGRHCWNLVCIKGTYYHLDVCLGDPVLEELLAKSGIIDALRFGGFNYDCFCVSTEEISKTRSIEDADSLPNCDRSLEEERIEALSRISIKQRNSDVGCLLSHNGSSADIYLCSKDKNVVLKKFRNPSKVKCSEEYGYMDGLRGCRHLIQLNEKYTNLNNNIIAIEQSTPIVDLFCSHYFHPTLQSTLSMVRDISEGWQECYERGILYRDLHVCNIYKASGGIYKLGDFGSCICQLRGVHERAGNQWFMSPETYINGHFDERSAVYSITVVLYFILNGLQPPFVNGNNEAEALRKKISGETLPIPSLLSTFPKELADMIMNRIITKGCAYYPSERIQSTKALLTEINYLYKMAKRQDVEIRFLRQYSDEVLNIASLNVGIPRGVHHRFAYGEEVERTATTAASVFINTDGDIQDVFSGNQQYVDDVENYCTTMGAGEPRHHGLVKSDSTNTFEPRTSSLKNSSPGSKVSLWKLLFKKKERSVEVYSSIFAPAEVKTNSHLQIQIYLHLNEETEKVKALAQESDKNAERRDYIPLQCKLKKGDKVDVQMNIFGKTLLMTDKKSVIWRGSFTKCSFDYFLPRDNDVDELSCMALLSVNGIPVGEMRFITKIVDNPRQLNPEIIAHKFSKVFVSYSHKDEPKVRFLHEGLELGGVPHFFDRKYLKTGDVFPQVIQDYINSADLFVLCWSENSAKSEYVEKERKQALERAFPQVKPQQAAKLSIYPMSIEPRAELPSDMKDNYHFGEI